MVSIDRLRPRAGMSAGITWRVERKSGRQSCRGVPSIERCAIHAWTAGGDWVGARRRHDASSLRLALRGALCGKCAVEVLKGAGALQLPGADENHILHYRCAPKLVATAFAPASPYHPFRAAGRENTVVQCWSMFTGRTPTVVGGLRHEGYGTG